MRQLLYTVFIPFFLVPLTLQAQDVETPSWQNDQIPGSAAHLIDLNDGQYHYDEIDPSMAKKQWLALTLEANGEYRLQKIQLHFSRVADLIMEEEPDPAKRLGWQVAARPKLEKLAFALSGLNLPLGKVATVDIPKIKYPAEWATKYQGWSITQILPNQTVAFTFAGSSYTLFALGETTPQKCLHYRLNLRTQRDGQTITQSLVNEEYCDGLADDRVDAQILFAGDLDRDGKPDFIIDPGGENRSQPSLFLSSAAHKDQLVKKVAQHTSIGC